MLRPRQRSSAMTGIHPTDACVHLAHFCRTPCARSERGHKHSSAEMCWRHRLGQKKESEHHQPLTLIFSFDLFCVHRPKLHKHCKRVYKDWSASCCSKNDVTVKSWRWSYSLQREVSGTRRYPHHLYPSTVWLVYSQPFYSLVFT